MKIATVAWEKYVKGVCQTYPLTGKEDDGMAFSLDKGFYRM